jgi:hypothetical protein
MVAICPPNRCQKINADRGSGDPADVATTVLQATDEAQSGLPPFSMFKSGQFTPFSKRRWQSRVSVIIRTRWRAELTRWMAQTSGSEK